MEKLTVKEKIFYGLICNENRVYRHWYTRFLICGIDLSRMQRVTGRIGSYYDWCRQWTLEGDHVQELADRALASDNPQTAEKLFHEAAGCYHVGQHFFYIDAKQKEKALQRVWSAYEKAIQLHDPRTRPVRLDIPFRDKRIPGYLRLCSEPDRPLVIFINGMDNLKEIEQNTWSEYFQGAGLNAFVFDGPGQGEMLKDLAFIPDYHTVVSQIIDWFEANNTYGIDMGRIGTVGFSLGGYLSPQAAAHDKRICCAVGNGGPGTLDLLPPEGRINPILRRGFMHISKTRTYRDAKDHCRMDIQLAPRMDRPLLIFHSGGDRLFPNGKAHADYFMNWADGEKELKYYPTGEHVCADYLDEVLPYTLDWLKRKLRVRE